jgi:hypothetical protein
MNRADFEKLMVGGGEGLSPEQQAAVSMYKALVCIADADPVEFWQMMFPEHHVEVLAILDAVVEKLVGLSVAERLRMIGKVAQGRRS